MTCLDEYVLTVEPHSEWELYWSVWTHESVPGDREYFRSYSSKVAAWHHAAWHRFHKRDTLPVISPGNWFVPRDGDGWTSDPRFAAEQPAHDVSPEDFKRIVNAVVRFVRARAGTMTPLEAFMPSDVNEFTESEAADLQEYAADNLTIDEAIAEAENPCAEVESGGAADYGPESGRALAASGNWPVTIQGDSEGLSGDEGTPAPVDPREAARDALPDAERRAFDNYSDLAESAPSQQGRDYWQSKADALISQENWVTA